MIDLTMRLEGLEGFRGAVESATARLVGDTVRAVEQAGDAGKATARVLAPHRSYELRNSIDARITSRTSIGADADLEALADHASMVRDGTQPHNILPRRKRFLRFATAGGIVFSRGVRHPGTKPNPGWWIRGGVVAGETLDARCSDAVAVFCSTLSK